MKWPSLFKKPAEYEAPAKGLKGTTIRVSDKRRATADRFKEKQELDQHSAFFEIYEITIAGSIIDTETDDLFAQGWAINGENPDEVAKVREYLEAVGFESAVKQMATESKIFGFGIAEVGTQGARHVLVPHTTLNIIPIHDEDGWLEGFEQKGANGTILAQWRTNQVVTLALRPSATTPGIGRSQLAQAYSAIINYEDIRKANCEMVLRMGYPTYDVEFGDDGLAPLGALEGDVADFGPGSVISTALGTKINTLNAQGVTQVQTYAEMALQAVAVAMQVPRSMVGLADNSEATAKVTQAKYFNRISAEQNLIAHTIQTEYLERYVLPDLGIKRGAIQLFFNNPDPEAQLKKAQLLQILTALDPTDPEFLLSVEEMAEIWGKHPKAGEYDTDKVQDMLLERVARHIADIQGGAPAEDPKEGTQ
jgi:hypothetical protein